jgi:hypothetical protein
MEAYGLSLAFFGEGLKMEISNYAEQPKGGSIIAIFSVYIPQIPLTIHKVKLVRTKKGSLIVGLPSYAVEQRDGTKKWEPYFEFGENQRKVFSDTVLELIKTYM